MSNRVSDLSPLAHLSQLEILYCNEISDLLPLAELTTLESLGLGSNRVSDLSPLVELTNLEPTKSNLLSGNRVSDLSSLLELTNLKDDVQSNPLNPETMEPLTKGVFVNFIRRISEEIMSRFLCRSTTVQHVTPRRLMDWVHDPSCANGQHTGCQPRDLSINLRVPQSQTLRWQPGLEFATNLTDLHLRNNQLIAPRGNGVKTCLSQD